MTRATIIDHSLFSAAARRRILLSWAERLHNNYDRYFNCTKICSHEELEGNWLKYLVNMALEFCISQDPLIRHVYISERLRFFSEFQNWEAKQKFYLDIIEKDNDAIILEVPDAHKPAVRQRLDDLHRSISAPKTSSFKLMLVGDCLFDEILMNIQELCAQSAISLEVKQYFLGAYVQDQFDNNTAHEVVSSIDESVDAVGISFFTYWGIPQFRALLLGVAKQQIAEHEYDGYLNEIFDYVNSFVNNIRERSSTPILLHNASGVPWLITNNYFRKSILDVGINHTPPEWEIIIGEINSRIDALRDKYENVILVDERKTVMDTGRENCLRAVIDPRFWLDSLFHVFVLGYKTSEHYLHILTTMIKLKKAKVLLVDLDNTLWSGVMAEESVTHHRYRQKHLKLLVEEGMLLVALSKNDPINIRWSELTLAKSDFVSLELTWENKVDVIQKISNDLNLDINSFVFIDDCQHQLGLMSYYYPQIPCFDSNDERTWSQIELLRSMKNTSKSSEARNRNQLYKHGMLREGATRNTGNGHSLLPLNIRVEASLLCEASVNRAVELLHRTNQFNCTGKRYNRAELLNMSLSPIWEVWTYHLSDKFGEMGQVGVVVINKKLSSKTIIFDTFVMSCRAMGYGLENFMVLHILNIYKDFKFVGVYRATSKNNPCKNLYANLSFQSLDGEEWRLSETVDLPLIPVWINQ